MQTMPRRPKGASNKSRDPLFKLVGYGKIGGDQTVVRSGGRIKKAKTIFDPSDSILGKDSPKPPDRDPERKSVSGASTPVPEKRRLSVASQVTTISAKTNLSSSSLSTNGVGSKKRKLEINSSTLSLAKETPTAEAPQSPRKPQISITAVKSNSHKEMPGVINVKSISLLKPKPVGPAKNESNTSSVPSLSQIQVSVVPSPVVVYSQAMPAAAPAPPTKRKMVTYQCFVCTKFDAMESSQWAKCHGCMVNVHKTCTGPPGQRLGPWMCRKCTICTDCEEQVTVEDDACCNACFSFYHMECLSPGEAPAVGGTHDWTCQYCKTTQKKKRNLQAAQQQKETDKRPQPPTTTTTTTTTKTKTTVTGQGKGPTTVAEKKAAPTPKAQVAITAGGADKKTIKGVTITQKTTPGRGRPPKVVPVPVRNPTPATVVVPKREAYNPLGGAEVPDASKWTAEDVYHHFADRFPKEAVTLQEQEIDGVSLLLMRRSDVVQGLGFKLGPGLRIWKQIMMLQTRDTDPTLTWY